MNTPDFQINCIKSLLALAGLWYLLFWLYRDFRLDVFRQELFALRDRLFDLSTNQSLNYDHPAYGTLRRTINGFIRFGHRLTLNQVILLVIVSRYRRTQVVHSFDARWERVVVNLPEPLRRDLEGIVQSMHRAVIKHLMLSSPLLLVLMASLVVPILFGIAWWFHLDRSIRRFGRPLKLIDSVAVAYGA